MVGYHDHDELTHIESKIEEVLKKTSTQGRTLWKILIKQHPADIALLISNLKEKYQTPILKKLPSTLAASVFEFLPGPLQSAFIKTLDSEYATDILKKMPVDDLTDLFEEFSDEEVKKYLNLLQKKIRKQVLSLLSFAPDSAGGIMNSEVITLPEDITVEKSISLLQRIKIKKEHLACIYVTDKEHTLRGYINLDSLITNKPNTPIKKILNESECILNVHEDQEEVAQKMKHYSVLAAPVTDANNTFLGIITADDVLNVIEEEASEDVYKMSGMSPVEHSYFQTSFWRLIAQRSPWLIGLLFLQSISSLIMRSYHVVLDGNIILAFFLTMLIGTGGNAGNQSGALVIRGLATGEVGKKNGLRMLLREFGISIIMAIILGTISFARVMLTPESTLLAAFAISISLFFIVITSMILGTFIPILFQRMKIDPAHSAAPFLATLMDIIGILIYCVVSSKILG
jgi:magnesium transporter